ncbi:MFS transporter [Agrilactobacillus composti]|uniref:MFS transporter n=1 Tax=Agrilactobacillus composti TaxID=398555 RepID=UPI0007054B2A|nr:MFS transporter [Agrilactobacillus composti]
MKSKQKIIILAMAIGIFLCVLDTTVMNIALPAIQTGLHVSLDDLSWALNIYTITFAVFTIPLGRLADIFGRHKLYILGLGLFTLGSALSGLAPNLALLIAGRGIQSLGAATIFPAGMTIGISATSMANRTKVVAVLGVMQGLAAALGPTIGGIITQFLGWRWVFMINVPACLVIALLVSRSLSFKHEATIAAKIDYPGMVLSMVTLFTLTLALIKGNDWHWNSPLILSLCGLSLLALLGFILVERHSQHPMIPLDLFKNRQFTGASIAMIITGIFLVAFMVIMPTFFTKIQGHSELAAALMITPTSAMIFLFSPISGFLVAKLGPRLVIASGFLGLIAGYLVLYNMNPNNYHQVVWACLFIGMGFGIIAGPIVVLGAADFTGELLTASQSVLGLFRQIGSVLAVAIFVSALTANLNTAKATATQTANQQIEQLHIPRAAKTTMQQQTDRQINNANSQPSGTTTPKKHVSATEISQLIETNYQQALAKIGNAALLPTEVKAQIHARVAAGVQRKVRQENTSINRTVSTIKANTKAQITQAFMRPYRLALPFLILASLTSLLFYRKQDYLPA